MMLVLKLHWGLMFMLQVNPNPNPSLADVQRKLEMLIAHRAYYPDAQGLRFFGSVQAWLGSGNDCCRLVSNGT